MVIIRSLTLFVFLSLSACAYRSEVVHTTPHRSEIGVASYYGHPHKSIVSLSKTASGEVHDSRQLTAAHRTLPFGSLVKVQNLSNNKSVIVKINDRGPFVEGRILDLSYAAAAQLDMIKAGKTKVRLTYLEVEAKNQEKSPTCANF